MDEKFKLAGNRRMCGIANDVSRPIVLNDMHDEYTLVLKYVPNYLPSYFIHTALNLIGFFYVKEMNTHQTFH